MACCGKKRTKVNRAVRDHQVSNPEEGATPKPQPEIDPRIYYQYLGKTALTITGPNSHKRYRFGYPNAIVEVDARDKRAFAGVSVLGRVRKEAIVAT